MSNWYCSRCGTEFEAPGMAKNAECPTCGEILTNDPDIYYNMLRDCGFDDEYIMNS